RIRAAGLQEPGLLPAGADPPRTIAEHSIRSLCPPPCRQYSPICPRRPVGSQPRPPAASEERSRHLSLQRDRVAVPSSPRRRDQNRPAPRKVSSGFFPQTPFPTYPFFRFMLLITIFPFPGETAVPIPFLIFCFSASFALNRFDLEVPTEIDSMPAISSCL